MLARSLAHGFGRLARQSAGEQTLGFDLTPIELARNRGNAEAVMLLLARASPKVRFLDACWSADGERARAELAAHPS